MSNRKWKNRTYNVETLKDEQPKKRRELSKTWKICLIALFLIAIPSFLVFVLFGKDGWVIPATKNLSLGALFGMAIGLLAVQIAVIAALIWGFKVIPWDSTLMLIPIAFSMVSFIVSSGASAWYIRVLPAVALAFLAVILFAIKSAVEKKVTKKQQEKQQAYDRINKSLLD
ncbi:hypothetical protein JN00_0355 [Metamycoplasma subdolum]|uniref:Uncharacterized protein n=1 Tax=Metamycoplasma subdolum TaxID=92407 RepID=A0A3M0A7S8_9BACT|nr:hypothetical protein [Metamycoplasma subdolum]RMA78525.1 hypothetical protein JN00_0355 [Metamycoplasma subdolum]WPB50457.1 hypothetical protein R9C05_02520 [Metamycoplasma subdolum]